MTHHRLPDVGRDWLGSVQSAFLIRDPAAVLASYSQKRAHVALADIGIGQQREPFDREADRLDHAPPRVDGADVLAQLAHVLSLLCAALDLTFSPAMLRWPAGRQPTDGAWAPAWYAAVERSTSFEAPSLRSDRPLSKELQRLAEAAQPYYTAMAAHRLHQGPELLRFPTLTKLYPHWCRRDRDVLY
jgi:hypothetical protein